MNTPHDPNAPTTPFQAPPYAGPDPVTDSPAEPPAAPGRVRRWRGALTRGRAAVAVGGLIAALAVGGIGFGAGYAVADHGTDSTGTTQQTPAFGDDDGGRYGGPHGGFPGGPRDDLPDGQADGQIGGPADGQGGSSGLTGQAPDFDGDGQPDDTTGSSGDSSTDGTT